MAAKALTEKLIPEAIATMILSNVLSAIMASSFAAEDLGPGEVASPFCHFCVTLIAPAIELPPEPTFDRPSAGAALPASDEECPLQPILQRNLGQHLNAGQIPVVQFANERVVITQIPDEAGATGCSYISV